MKDSHLTFSSVIHHVIYEGFSEVFLHYLVLSGNLKFSRMDGVSISLGSAPRKLCHLSFVQSNKINDYW